MTLNDGNWIEDGAAARPARAPRLMRAMKRALIAALALLVLYVAGFLFFAAHVAAMKVPERIDPADAIIVFTGGHLRLEPAVNLLREGVGRRLLISGVHPDADMRALQRATGAEAPLFACCVDIDHAALDTIGNAVETAKWLKANHFSSAILVTNNYHVPRSLIELRQQARNATLSAYPVVNARLDGLRWLVNRDVLRVLFIEYSKFVAALGRNLFSAGGVPVIGPTLART